MDRIKLVDDLDFGLGKINNLRLSDFFELVPDAIYVVDQDMKVVVWNEAMSQLTGVLAFDIIGKGDHEYTIPFYGEKRKNLIDLLLAPDQEFEDKYHNFNKDQNVVSAEAYCPNLHQGAGGWIYATTRVLHNRDGHPVGVIELIRDITQQKKNEKLLKQREENFSHLFHRAPLGYQSLDEHGCFLEVNDAWLSTLGYSMNEVVGKWFGDFLAIDYVEPFKKRFELFKSLGKIHSEFQIKHKNGEYRTVAFDGKIGYKEDGHFDKTHCILQDITERRLIENQLIESEQTYKALFDFSGVGIAYFTLDGKVISYNKKTADIFGIDIHDYEGKSLFDIYDAGPAQIFYERLVECGSQDGIKEYEDLLPTATGTKWFFTTFSRVLDKDHHTKGIQLILRDITELKRNEEEILYLSYHDQLTGLYNRRFFEEELLRLDTPRNYPLTIAFGDVNGLKLINDSLGHAMGDEVLKCTAKVLKNACRQDDIITRVGGDEFAIIFPQTNEEDMDRIIKRIHHGAKQEKIGPINLSVSFGYQTKTSIDQKINDIVKDAENFMYSHKLNDSTSHANVTIKLIMNTLFEKNPREMKHSERVSSICYEISTHLGYSHEECMKMKSIGLLHDIGKIGVSETTLNSSSILSSEEWKDIKKHTEIGYRILRSASEFTSIAEAVLQHHERFDGKGYPQGLKGEGISPYARIVSIADAFDAMVSERPYRKYSKAMEVQDALKEIREKAGTQFDPLIAHVFIEKVMNQNWETAV